jgi:outer membrane protein
MKRLFTFLTIACLSFGNILSAQKIGHINSNELLLAMPERAQIETEIQNHAKQLETQLLAMQRELETKYQDFQAKESLMTEAIREDKIKELTSLEQRLNEFQERAQADLQKKEQSLTEPLISKAKNAIEKVAKENGYTYILDSGIGFMLYIDATTAEDIMPLVKKELGLQ